MRETQHVILYTEIQFWNNRFISSEIENCIISIVDILTQFLHILFIGNLLYDYIVLTPKI